MPVLPGLPRRDGDRRARRHQSPAPPERARRAHRSPRAYASKVAACDATPDASRCTVRTHEAAPWSASPRAIRRRSASAADAQCPRPPLPLRRSFPDRRTAAGFSWRWRVFFRCRPRAAMRLRAFRSRRARHGVRRALRSCAACRAGPDSRVPRIAASSARRACAPPVRPVCRAAARCARQGRCRRSFDSSLSSFPSIGQKGNRHEWNDAKVGCPGVPRATSCA